jgi:hypothetical protein
MNEDAAEKAKQQEMELVRWGEQTNEIAADLVRKMPGLHYITASIMANDILSARYRTEQVESGERKAEQVVWLIGSYARWDWAVTMLAAGRLTDAWFDENIADLWRGSDPDDTSAVNLSVWKTAARKSGSYVRDGRPLPKGKDGFITVFRGGPPAMSTLQGFAWTTDPKIAQKFASGAGERIQRKDGVVIKGTVMRSQVLAYLTGRGESEVIVDPLNVRGVGPVNQKGATA